MTELRDKSHALIFDNKKDLPLYRIRKDIKEIKELLKEIKLELKKMRNEHE